MYDGFQPIYVGLLKLNEMRHCFYKQFHLFFCDFAFCSKFLYFSNFCGVTKMKSSMPTLDTPESMTGSVFSSQLWQLLEHSYAQVAGGLHFSSQQALLAESGRWRLAVEGDQLLAAVVYKPKKGWKLSALGINPQQRSVGRSGLQRILREDLPYSWMAVSEGAERFVLEQCRGDRFLIHNSLVPSLLGKNEIEPAADGFHYRRHVCGQHKSKIALGSPQW